jgi:aromatic-amino-acid transaminase
MFSHLEPYAGDPILSLNEQFQKDPRPGKVNLSIGIYFDEAGRIPLLASVAQAQRQWLEQGRPKPYLPMEGDAAFRQAVVELLFGQGHEVLQSRRVACIQAVGSSGGLKVGADFLRRFFPQACVYLSQPTWDNHRAVFEGAGLQTQDYPYYHTPSKAIDFEGLCQAVQGMPAGSVVLLHACCHNPTGVDLSPAQWDALIPLLQKAQVLPFLDLAYQGYGSGMEEDALPLRRLAEAGLSFLVVNSFSKNMGLYGERVGALSVVCPDAAQAEVVLGQFKATVRRQYSSPPMHGAQVAATLLNDAVLRQQWLHEVAAMRQRILCMRQGLYDGLQVLGSGHDVGFLLAQKGMFSYTGLSPQQVDALRDEHAVYLVRSGRLCVAGLNEGNLQATVRALGAVLGAG